MDRCETHDAVLVWCTECIAVDRAAWRARVAAVTAERDALETQRNTAAIEAGKWLQEVTGLQHEIVQWRRAMGLVRAALDAAEGR